MYNLEERRVFIITFIKYTHSQKIGKPNNLKVYGSRLTKGAERDSQNWLALAYIAEID
jgi:hypothetical protein